MPIVRKKSPWSDFVYTGKELLVKYGCRYRHPTNKFCLIENEISIHLERGL